MNYLGLVTSAGKLKCSQTSFDEGEFRVAEFIHENFCSCPCNNLVYEATEKALGDCRKPDRCPQSIQLIENTLSCETLLVSILVGDE